MSVEGPAQDTGEHWGSNRQEWPPHRGDMRWWESLLYERVGRNIGSKWAWLRREIRLFPIWKRLRAYGLE